MDRGGEFLAAITSWFTPTIFFCLFNLTVVTIFIQSSLKPKQNNQEHQDRLDSEENDSVHFFRFPKLLERVKSINLSRTYFSEPEDTPHHVEHQEQEHPVEEQEPVLEPVEEEEEEEERHVERTVSEKMVKTYVKREMRKSQSAKVMKVEEVEEVEEEKWRPATMREKRGGVREDEAVDAKADDFINRFKQQLKLQRLDSLLRFRAASN